MSDFADRAAALREEARAGIASAIAEHEQALASLNAADEKLHNAIVAAADLGISRKDIAEQAGASVSWVAQRLRSA